ncbi:MAG TPA: methylmalonyl-CoA mutase subunit beta [Trebonia sp.]|jgi:methylmalonyl-CoA mutase|nr:methylmalonyl-CoA mutase subunit beta [Trebonia sp.]
MTDVAAGEPDDLVLAAEFPAVTRRQWQRLVATVIGVDGDVDSPERQLATVTGDGIEIDPLYVDDGGRPAPGYPGQPPFVRGRGPAGTRAGWDVRQRHEHPDPAVAREQIMEDLEGGVSSLWLGLGDGRIPVDALPEVLAETYLDLAPIVLDAGDRFAEAAEVYLAVAAGRGVPPGALAGCLGADPLGVLARTAAGADQSDQAPTELPATNRASIKPAATDQAATDSPADLAATAGLTAAADLARRCAADFPGLRAIVVDALPYHEAGGTDAEELGCALAAGLEYLRAMQAAGLPAEAAFGQLEFRLAATADQFATIAKLRAARRVWSRVAQQCGVTSEAAGMRQHVVSSWPMMTRRDPWNNILRATLACFSAGVGGADAITVAPFDTAIGQPDRLARRVARNVHALLVEESHVARVIDPAGGSWYVEDLSEQLAVKAWAWFQEIEQSGGLRAALAAGIIADRLAASRRQHRDSLATRREAITGVTEFPLIGETLLSRPAIARPAAAAAGLPRIRWSQWHEALRDRADEHALATGSPPMVTLAPVDASRASVAQSDRVRALLAPAGITTTTAAPPVPVVIVCGGRDAPADQVLAAVEEARGQGASTVVVAAGDQQTPVPGAAERIIDDMDVLAFCGRLLDALGVQR